MRAFGERLVACDSKNTAKRAIKEHKLELKSFKDLIEFFKEQGYTYECKQREFSSPHAANVPAFIETLSGGSKSDSLENKEAARKAMNKIEAVFNERKQIMGHIFVKSDEWHLFFFSEADYRGDHYHASHVHYSSHFWHTSSEYVWDELEKRKYDIKSEHLEAVLL